MAFNKALAPIFYRPRPSRRAFQALLRMRAVGRSLHPIALVCRQSIEVGNRSPDIARNDAEKRFRRWREEANIEVGVGVVVLLLMGRI